LYNEEMQSKEKKQWLKAMKEKLASLKENETWELVNKPVKSKVIENLWEKARFSVMWQQRSL